jgi:hypothetical protein
MPWYNWKYVESGIKHHKQKSKRPGKKPDINME